MAAIEPISQLPSAGPITGPEIVPVVQGGVTMRSTASGLMAALLSATSAAGIGVNDNAGGSLFTTLQGQTNYLQSTLGASTVGYQLSAVGTVSRTARDKLGELRTAADFGAKGDAIGRADGAVTATSTAFTSASASFAPADVGKCIIIQGAGAGGVPLVTTIAAYVSSNAVTLTNAAVTTVSAAVFLYGTDNTTALNAAYASGLSFGIDTGNYICGGVTGSTAGQRVRAIGNVVLFNNNPSAPLLTHSGDYSEHYGIHSDGQALGGAGAGQDNLKFTGSHQRVFFCGGVNTWAIPLHCTGAAPFIDGTCASYTTLDQTSTGWDVVCGTPGVATLYGNIRGMYNGQHAGGIKLIDTGGFSIVGGETGKVYTFQSVSPPIGTNGGCWQGVRITGAVEIGAANTTMVGCEFASTSFTIDSGVTGTILVGNLGTAGWSVINNSGNTNHLFFYGNYSSGNYGLLLGASGDKAGLTFNASTGQLTLPGGLTIPYGTNLIALDNVGASAISTTVSGVNATLALSNPAGSGFGILASGSGGRYDSVSGTNITQTYSGGVRPVTDNSVVSGTASQAWANLVSYYLTNKTRTVSQLTAAATAGAGARAFVSDSTVAASGNFGAVVAGTGSNQVPVFSDGTNWRIG